MADPERNHDAVLADESRKVAARIDGAYAKLAAKLRAKADKARDALDGRRSETKRAVLRKRFELYADAATEIEERLLARRGPDFERD